MSGQEYYIPPQGPPPGHHQSQPQPNTDPYTQQQQHQQQPPPPGQPPHRTGTFEETQFVPDSERGEQREALEQFEMNKRAPPSQEERDMEVLQREFPNVDGSLIAALYGDAGGSLGAVREMLGELQGGR